MNQLTTKDIQTLHMHSLTRHIMVHFTTDVVHLVGGRAHTVHHIPSGIPVYAPGAGHSALTQQNVYGWGRTTVVGTQLAQTHAWMHA